MTDAFVSALKSLLKCNARSWWDRTQMIHYHHSSSDEKVSNVPHLRGISFWGLMLRNVSNYFWNFILLPFMYVWERFNWIIIFGWRHLSNASFFLAGNSVKYLAKKRQVWKPGHLMGNTDPHVVYPATTNVCWWGFNIYGMFPQSNSFLIYTLWKSMLVTI